MTVWRVRATSCWPCQEQPTSPESGKILSNIYITGSIKIILLVFGYYLYLDLDSFDVYYRVMFSSLDPEIRIVHNAGVLLQILLLLRIPACM